MKVDVIIFKAEAPQLYITVGVSFMGIYARVKQYIWMPIKDIPTDKGEHWSGYYRSIVACS